MALKFGKVENNSEAANRDYAPAIQMGIENAPTKLIVKYITDMYSNPLRAALRETVSNALDAAIAAGGSASDIDFHIEPQTRGYGNNSGTFRVLDRGAGMTYDTLVNVYTQYGVSDKRDDDTSTGAFGLGAKSPLAYTDEFSVITKTEEDGCLFVRAYRTADDDFIADLPVKIDEASELVVWRNLQGRIVPKTLDENGDIAPMPDNTFEQTETVHDVFGDATGTVVSFRIASMDMRDAQDVVSSMHMLLNTYDNAGYEDTAAYTTFDFGTVSVDDADGNSIEMRVLAQGTGTRDYFTQDFICFNKACEGVRFELDKVAFKVGNWLYPADGKAWQPDFVYSLIIDVPSRALPFTPSRDNLRRDGDNDNAASLAHIANDYVIEKLSDDKVVCELLNAMTATRGTGNVCYSLRSLFPNAVVDSQITAGKITVRPRNGQIRVFDTSALSGFGKWSVADLVDTPACVMGAFEANSDGTVRNTGIYVTADLPARKVFGAAVGCTHNHNDVSGAPNYATSKSRTIADGVYGYSYEPNGTIVYSHKHLRDAASRFSSLAQTPFFPFGCAMLNIGFSTSLYRKNGVLLLVDASQAGIAKTRNIVKRIAETADYNWCDASVCRYALIPPKSATENWDIEELSDFVALVEDMCSAQNADFVFVDAAGVDDVLAAKPKSSSKKQTDTLSPMLSNGRIIRLEIAENETEPEKTITKLAGSRHWKPNAKNVIAAMREHPANWGVVVASDEHARAYEVAYDYAHAMLALELVPENIVNIACISSHNFSAARASALAEMGVAVIYDECGKGTDNALIAKGTFTLNNAARYHGYLNYNSDNIPAPLAEYRSYLTREALHDTYYNTMRTALTGDRWGSQGYSAFSLDWVKIFSMEHEDAAAVEGTCPEEDWRCAGFNLISGNKGTQGSSERFDEKTREQMSRVDDCCRIWRHTLEGTGLKISLELLDSNKLNGYAHLADALGVASTIDSYYRGVPLDDLLA